MRWRLQSKPGATRRATRRARVGVEDLEGRQLLNGAMPTAVAAPQAQYAAAPHAVHAARVSIASVGPKNEADMERHLTTPTASYVYSGIDPATLSWLISQNQGRLTDIQVESTSPYRFTVSMVKNSGDYGKAWWYYYGIDANMLSEMISINNARLIDLDTYHVNGNTRFAAIMVANTGDDAKAWWYYTDVSTSFVSQKLHDNGARLVDVDREDNGNLSAVMVRNSGIDARAWWWYTGVSASQVGTFLQQNQARLTEFQRQPDGNFTVIMVRNTGTRWYYFYGASGQGLVSFALAHNARIFDLESYQLNGQKLFAAVMIGNP